MTHRRADHKTSLVRSGPDGRTEQQTVQTNCTNKISRCMFCFPTMMKPISKDLFQIGLQFSLWFCKPFLEVFRHHLGILFCLLLPCKKLCNGMLLFLQGLLLHSGSFRVILLHLGKLPFLFLPTGQRFFLLLFFLLLSGHSLLLFHDELPHSFLLLLHSFPLSSSLNDVVHLLSFHATTAVTTDTLSVFFQLFKTVVTVKSLILKVFSNTTARQAICGSRIPMPAILRRTKECRHLAN